MFDPIELGSEFFEGLMSIDRAVVEQAAAERCRHCGGPLHRSDYPRKPRGGLFGVWAEAFERRFSLCCGKDGCRRRATPPSVRFLGRRVYAGAVVVMVSAVAVSMIVAREIVRKTGVPARTVRRWLRWWRSTFTSSSTFMELSGRLVPAVDRSKVPASLLERFAAPPLVGISKLLAWLGPITTTSWPDGSRLLRGAM